MTSDDGLLHYLATGNVPLPDVDSLVSWVWGLAPFGKEALVVAAVSAARLCEGLWRRGVPQSEYWQRKYAGNLALAAAIEGAAAWSVCPCDKHLSQAAAAARAASQVLDAMFKDYDELGGPEEVRAAGLRALEAATASSLAADAAAWTPDSVSAKLDPVERATQIASGPANEAAQAVASTVKSTGLPVTEVHALIRGALVRAFSPSSS